MPQLTDPDLIRRRLEADRPWAAFALADLEPTYFPFAKWFCPPDSSQSVALLYGAFTIPIVVCVGSSQHWDTVLDEIDAELGDSEEVYVVVRPEVMPLIRNRYYTREERLMLRMVLDANSYRPALSQSVRRLGTNDLDAVQALYMNEPPDFFLPAMLKDGIYYGIHESDQLVAVAGTHVVAPSVSIGGLGNIYTRRDRRGRGLCTSVTSAVTSELLQMGLTMIVLNVREGNHPAIRVYERLGYKQYCNYYEVIASRQREGGSG